MNKLKDILPNVFSGSNKDKQKSAANGKLETLTKTKKLQKQATTVETVGRLETDAAPVTPSDDVNRNYAAQTNANSTPTASTEMTEAVVRELSDPNYNSLELAENTSSGQLAQVTNNVNTLAPHTNTMNAMNVNSAQQQLVMQFSNVQKIHFGQVYNIGGSNSSSSSHSKSASCSRKSSNCSATSETPLKTTTIVEMMQSQEEPTYRILDTVSTHLGSNYKQVMRELGISDGQIEQAIIDHTNCGGTKEVIHQLLLLWLRSADDGEGTLGRLTCVLWEKNSRECVQRMKMVYKSEKTRKPRNEVK